jgi:cation diffusion facilitator CzcD-associated flavoprotein CzcO
VSDAAADVLVIGGGPAGLAVAGALKHEGVDALVLERDQAGDSWRTRYDRLRLHTPRSISGLPYWPMPRDYPRYPSRDQVVDYLEAYAQHFGLELREGAEVSRLSPDDGGWAAQAGDERYRARFVVVATGASSAPVMPEWSGREAFAGELLHSSRYKNGDPWRGKRALVVGFGSSGGEIALDLVERGAASVTMCVRSAVNVVPRDPLGIPFMYWTLSGRQLPPRLGDLTFAPLIRLLFGDITKLGLRKAADGPLVTVHRTGQVPLIDIGTMSLIREGRIAVRPGIERFTETGVVFVDGSSLDVDVVVSATGYKPRLDRFLADSDQLVDEHGNVPKRHSGVESPLSGLWLCGMWISPTGQIREMKLEAKRIARDIAGRLRRAA